MVFEGLSFGENKKLADASFEYDRSHEMNLFHRTPKIRNQFFCVRVEEFFI